MALNNIAQPPEGRLDESGRLAAFAATGLGADADPEIDRFAGLVRRILEAPVAFVSVVDTERQVFPGAVGLPEPWDALRCAPLSYSFCQIVVISRQPLVIADAREDARVRDNPAVRDLGVVAYAGMPLFDADGHVLGSLCAIDCRPREWSAADLGVLSDLAAACSAVLRSRIVAGIDLERSQLLLAASEELSDTATLDDVVDAVGRLVSGGLAPAHVSACIFDETSGRGRLVGAAGLPRSLVDRWGRFGLADPILPAQVVRTGVPLFIPDRAVGVEAERWRDDLDLGGWSAIAIAPLTGPGGVIGSLNIGWAAPHPTDVRERAVITLLAGYVTQALLRATHLRERATAAATLQQALLTPMPAVDGYDLIARYLPASHDDQVGGDWYDAVPLGPGRFALVIGDVTGHDIGAAAAMSELRSMLRGYLIDRHEPPSALLRRLDHANFALGAFTIATALVAYIGRADDGQVTMSWSNAGHPPPILVHADGQVRELRDRNPLLGASQRISRSNHTIHLPPGSTLLLHTDGLIESRTDSLADRAAKLHAMLADHAAAPLELLIDAVIAQLPASGTEDDVALIGLRTNAAETKEAG